MNRLNFEEDNHELVDDVQDSEFIMHECMASLYNMLIKPNKDKLTEEDAMALTLIAKNLWLMASKARAHELMNELGGLHPDSVN